MACGDRSGNIFLSDRAVSKASGAVVGLNPLWPWLLRDGCFSWVFISISQYGNVPVVGRCSHGAFGLAARLFPWGVAYLGALPAALRWMQWHALARATCRHGADEWMPPWFLTGLSLASSLATARPTPQLATNRSRLLGVLA